MCDCLHVFCNTCVSNCIIKNAVNTVVFIPRNVITARPPSNYSLAFVAIKTEMYGWLREIKKKNRITWMPTDGPCRLNVFFRINVALNSKIATHNQITNHLRKEYIILPISLYSHQQNYYTINGDSCCQKKFKTYPTQAGRNRVYMFWLTEVQVAVRKT